MSVERGRTSRYEEREPERIKVNTSLIERPLFAGVDLELIFVIALAVWSSFLVFGLTLPFFVVIVMCVVLFRTMQQSYKRDPYFLPVLFRSLLYRRTYAPRTGPLENSQARPSIPKRPIQP